MKSDRSEVHRSVDPFPSAVWHTYKTWNDAVNAWDVACRAGNVDIIRKDRRKVTASASSQTLTPARLNIRNPARRLASEYPSPTDTASAPLLSQAKKQLPLTIVISDSDSNNNEDSDSEIETTSPKPIKKLIDCFELYEEED